MNAQAQKDDSFERLKDRIKDVKVAMLFTEEEDGSYRSRPMYTHQVDDEGFLWFFTWKNSDKVLAIQRNPRINLGYSDPDDDVYATISGDAELSLDKTKMKELWNPMLKAWFPEGLDDPNLALLKITVKKAEYWDAASSKMVRLIGFVKAIVSKEPYKGEGTDNEKLTF